MDERRYWFLASAAEDASGELPEAITAVSAPWWPEAVKWEHREGIERVFAPVLYSTREAAEAQRLAHEAAELDSFRALNEEHGEEVMNRAWDHTSPLRVFGLDREELADKLEDADFLCVMVDDRLKLRQDFVAELGGA